ncbi:MAG: trehalose-phosphatase [Solirubrobacterales bacterium]|nr:trehalose-phosphatase [Solirubrobacterales bacterium]MBV9797987.1 trehalose-phosphatase [Solirubrobacterales bacterium]
MTAALLAEALAPLRANPQQAAILLDIDGTISPIVEHAADAKVPESTRQLLAAIARRYKIVACVTGRRAADARAMVSIGTISYLGTHGAELLRAGWTESVVDPKVEDWVRRIHQFGREADTAELRRLRVRLEDKGTIVAFHWRGAPNEDAARSALDTLASRAEQAGLRTHWGRKVLEIRPPVRMDKGAGITTFLEGEDVEAAMYAGDDATDLDAFRALAELQQQGTIKHAIRVGVRSDEGPSGISEQADVVVDGTEGMRDLLALLASD